jgi:hypothetical protein
MEQSALSEQVVHLFIIAQLGAGVVLLFVGLLVIGRVTARTAAVAAPIMIWAIWATGLWMIGQSGVYSIGMGLLVSMLYAVVIISVGTALEEYTRQSKRRK